MAWLLNSSGQSLSNISTVAGSGLEDLPSQPFAFVQQEGQIFLARAKVDDANAQPRAALQDRRREEEGSVADETVDDPSVHSVEGIVRDVAAARAVTEVQYREDRFGEAFEIRPLVDRR